MIAAQKDFRAQKRCFISYRTIDCHYMVGWLADRIDANFGRDTAVYADKIKPGESWSEEIEAAIANAAVVIALIGRLWAQDRDDDGRRRIDRDDDWVRRELILAYRSKRPIIPILLNGEDPPSRQALPEELSFVAEAQALRFSSAANYLSLLDSLFKGLVSFGLRQVASPPSHSRVVPPPGFKVLDEDDVNVFLKAHTHWSLEYRDGDSGERRLGLRRDFSFASFDEAIHFMSVAARDIRDNHHYPLWENVRECVRVWYSTWDSGFRVSTFDTQMAKRLDQLFDWHQKRRFILQREGKNWSSRTDF